jgi:hypothetical protein
LVVVLPDLIAGALRVDQLEQRVGSAPVRTYAPSRTWVAPMLSWVAVEFSEWQPPNAKHAPKTKAAFRTKAWDAQPSVVSHQQKRTKSDWKSLYFIGLLRNPASYERKKPTTTNVEKPSASAVPSSRKAAPAAARTRAAICGRPIVRSAVARGVEVTGARRDGAPDSKKWKLENAAMIALLKMLKHWCSNPGGTAAEI